MLIIGLTGGIGCGKSMVSDYFKELGIPVIDTDIIAKQIVEPDQVALAEIIQIFGKKIIDDENNLKRQLLREIIFNSPAKREQLESILHPKIRADVLRELATIEQNDISNKISYCIIVIPLLFETNSNYPIDRILVIDCSEKQQIERTMSRDNITRDQTLAILQNQVSRSIRLEKTDDIIKNNTDPDSCYSQIRDIHKQYLALVKSKSTS